MNTQLTTTSVPAKTPSAGIGAELFNLRVEHTAMLTRLTEMVDQVDDAVSGVASLVRDAVGEGELLDAAEDAGGLIRDLADYIRDKQQSTD